MGAFAFVCLILAVSTVNGQQDCSGFKQGAEEFVSVKYKEQNRR